MRNPVFFLSFLLFILLSCRLAAQNDTTNLTDTAGKKQGHWIILSKDRKGYPGMYEPMDRYEEGRYLDNKKTGVWTTYWPTQIKKSEIIYENGRPKGYARINFESGKIEEEGIWLGTRWVDWYKMYYPNGCLRQDWKYSKTGKRDGEQKYYHPSPCNAVWMEGMMKDGKEAGIWIEYDTSGKVTRKINYEIGVVVWDSTKVKPKPPSPGPKPPPYTPPPPKPFDCNGYAKLYNSQKLLTYDGVFKNCKLWSGKNYLYDKNGILTRIALFKEGKYVGDAPLEEQK